LKNLGADFVKTNRGGLITFHGPGQLVAYPIINLKNFKQGVRWYVCNIEKTVIDLCKKYDITAATTSDTGVWIGDRKICAIGIHVSRHVTMHGLALNCNIDLNWFNHIVPCGIEGKEATSLTKECKRSIGVHDVVPNLTASFETLFECKTATVDKAEVEQIKRLALEK
jgi:lipoate-protein ligase B